MDAYQMAAKLEAWAESQGFIAPPAYFIVGEFNLTAEDGSSVYSDEAHLWCKPCADALLARAIAILPADQHEDHFVCHTDATSEDTPPHCRACGETLDGSVSDYAIAEEIAHYAEHPIDPDETVNARQAVEIAQLLTAAPSDEEAIAIGKAALAAIARSS